MSAPTFSPEPPEPERYELDEPPRYLFDPTRRDVLRALGGGLVVVCLAPAVAAQDRGRGRGEAEPDPIDAWLHVDAEGGVTAYTGKAEVGQGIRTSLAQAVAEELGLPLDAVRLVMGDTDRTPYDRGTFGSRTTPAMAPLMRRAAAAAREVLLGLAAERWGAERVGLAVRDGAVAHPDGRTLGFGELTEGRALVERVAPEAPTTPPAEWTVCGRPAPHVGARAIVTGEHRYPSDVRRPGMLVGKVLRPPAFGAELTALDAGAARAIEGVTVVHDGTFAGVTAPDEPSAERALAALAAEWRRTPQVSRHELFAHLVESADAGDSGGRGRSSRESDGSLEEGLAAADVRLQQAYTVAYIAHAPLEPRAAVAEWTDDGRLAVWTGTQRPFGVRSELARAFGLPEERVHVVVPDTGSGYGGKHTGEAALEAARLAREAGRPVRVVWTREEEFTWAYFRPAGVIEVESGATADGALTAWRFHNYNSGSSGLRGTYRVPNAEHAFHRSDSPLRQGSYRALASVANHFARETHLDELARELALDPLALRLANLDDERQRAVLEAAAERFGWGGAPREGRGVGLAAGFEKAGYVATCAEVSLDRRGAPLVERLVTAFECGAIVDPAGLENQVVGCQIMGLGGALFEAVDFEDGRVLNPAFSRYRVPRFSDLPSIEAVLLDRPDLPSAGAGECPIVAVAPAVGNALFDLTGERRRALPLA